MDDEIEELAFDLPSRLDNPELPEGGRAALGVATGLAVASIASAAWSRIERGTWRFNDVGNHGFRIGVAGLSMLGATVGAGILSPAATRRGAMIGALTGAIAANVPLVWDPFLVKRHPVLGNLWQFGIPIAGAVIGANAVR